jgi:hypothetical protein
VVPDKENSSGFNTIHYKVLEPGQVLQVDLAATTQNRKGGTGWQNAWLRESRAFCLFCQTGETPAPGRARGHHGLSTPVRHGKQKERRGRRFFLEQGQVRDAIRGYFLSGLGASAWWPCKDHMYDEPDSMRIAVTTPGSLMDVSNGRFRGMKENPDSTKTWEWFVSNPINNYGVNVNIAQYTHFSDTLNGEKGILTLDYYVLPDNLEKAKTQFLQA